MSFRKDALLYYQHQAICIIMVIVVCCVLLPAIGLNLSLLYCFPFPLLMLLNIKLNNEFITIDEYGISCQKAGIQLWVYTWDDIADLKKKSRFLMPSIEIISHSKCGELEWFARSKHYFQLGKTAKKAIKRYYVGHISL